MRIEPVIKFFPRQPSKRRHQSDVLNLNTPRGRGAFTNSASGQGNDTPNAEIEGKDMVSVNMPNHGKTRPGSNRWRTFVPFIAQYIGQETSVETPARYARRHVEFAQKAYQRQNCFPAHPRTISHI